MFLFIFCIVFYDDLKKQNCLFSLIFSISKTILYFIYFIIILAKDTEIDNNNEKVEE